jgi:hypothetical protein
VSSDSSERSWTDEPTLRIDGVDGTRDVGLWDYLTPGYADQSEQEANAWIKALRSVEVDGRPLRDRFTYRGDSLWWFAEIYLHKTRGIADCFRTIYALDILMASERLASVRLTSRSAPTAWITQQLVKSHELKYEGPRRIPYRFWQEARSIRLRAQYFHLTDFLRGKGDAPASSGSPADVACFIHSAFWRNDEDVYVGPVLNELSKLVGDRLKVVGVGPGTQFRGRGWRQRADDFRQTTSDEDRIIRIDRLAGRGAITPSLSIWRERKTVERTLLSSAAINAASTVRDCNIRPIVENQLRGVAHLQFPWSARAIDEAGAALDALKPRVAVTYAEAGGWGRALILAARRRGIPVVALQHGFIYRHWLNYQHEPDEMSPSAGNSDDGGFPLPTVTLVHDELTLSHLTEAGRFPPERLAVTGSTRLDRLAASARALAPGDRDALRARLGAKEGQHLVVVASKFSQLGPAFPALASAVSDMDDVVVVVKCHPADDPDAYRHAASFAPNVRIAPPAEDLGQLLAVARVLVTVNSTAAIEAMVLGVPTLVVNLPNNLSPFVTANVMSGARRLDEIPLALRTLLYDEQRRSELAERRSTFLATHQIRSDGRAAARAAEAILHQMKGSS